jgi:hypothetical protein
MFRGEKMQCIYLDKDGNCRASPISAINDADRYKPEAGTLTKFCKHDYDMRSCPRLFTYQNHLKSQNGQ